MAVVGKSDFGTWAPKTWGSSGAALKTFANNLSGAADNFSSAVKTAGNDWEGSGFDGASRRSSADVKEIDAVVKELRTAGQNMVEAADVIAPIHSYILDTLVPDLELNHYSVSDSWVVKDVYPYKSEEQRALLEPSRLEWAAKNTTEIQAEVGRATTADAIHAKTIKTALDNLNGKVPRYSMAGNSTGPAPTGNKGYSAEQGKKDAKAIVDGTATDEQKKRFGEATKLSQEQQNSLKKGEEAAVNYPQFEYLKAVINEVDANGGLDAAEKFGGDNHELKKNFADAVNIVANPKVNNGLGELPPQMVKAEGLKLEHGGIKHLPESWQKPLTEPPSHMIRNGPLSEPGTEVVNPGRPIFTTIGDLRKIAGIQANSSEGTNSGSDVNRTLIARAGEIAELTDGEVKDGLFGRTEKSYLLGFTEIEKADDIGNLVTQNKVDVTMTQTEMRDSLNDILKSAGRDKVAVHDAMMSDDGPPRVSGIPGGTYKAPPHWEYAEGDAMNMKSGAYDADLVTKSLISYDWDEGAHQDDGVKTMLKGIGDANTIRATPGGTPPAGAAIAGESASELARHIANNKAHYLNMGDWHKYDSIGEVNKGVTVAMSEAVGPHLIGLAGGDQSAVGLAGAKPLDNLEQMKSVFAVLDTDPEAASVINTHGQAQIGVLQSAYGAGAEELPNGEFYSENYEGQTAGRISQAMIDGIKETVTDFDNDGKKEIADSYYKKATVFDTTRGIAKEVVGFMGAKGKAAKPFVDMLGTGLKPIIVGQQEFAGDYVSPEGKAIADGVRLVINGTQTDTPDTYVRLINGLSPEQLAHYSGYSNLSETKLAPFLDADGYVDQNKLQDGASVQRFLEAADATLGSFDEAWFGAYDKGTKDLNW